MGKKNIKNKSLSEILEALLKDDTVIEDGVKVSTKEAIMKAVINEALDGKLKAIEFIRDTIGEKPKEIIEQHQVAPIIVDDIDGIKPKKTKKI